MSNLRIGLILSIVLVLGFLAVGTLHLVHAQQPYSMPSTSTVPTYLQYLRVDGAMFQVPNIVTTATATTLTAAQSGSIVTLGAAAGYTVTLPTPAPGLYYDVESLVTQTSGTMKITSGSASIFMQGGLTLLGGTVANVACNGTSHTDIAMNGTTTGGIRGTWMRFTGLSATIWQVSGLVVGSGTEATPCDTTP